MDRTSPESTFDTATWMRDLKVLDVPFHRLRVPGTHNSHTYELHGTDPLASPFSTMAVPFYLVVPWVIRLWSRCQGLRIREQLEAGVRYLDVRVAVTDEGEVTTAHTFRAAPLADVLDDAADFYEAHGTTEVVVTSVKRDSENERTVDTAEARAKVRAAFAEHRVARYLSHGVAAPLSALLKRHGNRPLVLVFHDAIYASGSVGYAAPYYYAKWFDTNDPEQLRGDVADAIRDTLDRQTIAVIQNILTPRPRGHRPGRAALRRRGARRPLRGRHRRALRRARRVAGRPQPRHVGLRRRVAGAPRRRDPRRPPRAEPPVGEPPPNADVLKDTEGEDFNVLLVDDATPEFARQVVLRNRAFESV